MTKKTVSKSVKWQRSNGSMYHTPGHHTAAHGLFVDVYEADGSGSRELVVEGVIDGLQLSCSAWIACPLKDAKRIALDMARRLAG